MEYILKNIKNIHYNLSPTELIEKSLQLNQGELTETGALAVDTGSFTGRSPKDKYIVKDNITENTVWWGDVNYPISTDSFNILFNKMIKYVEDIEVYVNDGHVCADSNYKMNVRTITETPWANLFANNMFIRNDVNDFDIEWTILCIPSFKNDDKSLTSNSNFTIVNFTEKVLLIGGSGYTGEIKKGIFTVLNYILPEYHNVFPMHCSANVGKDNDDTALFFGLSATGKCLGKGTKILMYDGSIKKVEDIIVGDQIMGPDSTPRNILSLCRGEEQMYWVRQKKGIDYRVNESHILSLKSGKRSKFKKKTLPNQQHIDSKKRKRKLIFTGYEEGSILNISVKDYINSKTTLTRKYLGWKTGVDFQRKELEISPYFLGVWIGDGTSEKPQITSCSNEIVDFLNEYIPNMGMGMNIKEVEQFNNRSKSYNISGNGIKRKIIQYVENIDDENSIIWKSIIDAAKELNFSANSIYSACKQNKKYKGFYWEYFEKKNVNLILNFLRSENLINNKHIPLKYLLNDRESRLELLAGLIDTDGSYSFDDNYYEITQKNKLLSEQILFLSRSLGFHVTLNEKKATMKRNDGSIYECIVYRTIIAGEINVIPCKVNYKKARKSKLKKNPLIYGIRVEKDIVDEYYGFTIDGDHLFLLEDFTVTHNTTLSTDPDRSLIGDDEHGWSNKSVFNFEGGCYAKTVGLSKDKEPEIFNAIKYGALLENINFIDNSRTVDYNNVDKTENTRVSYPLDYIPNVMKPSIGAIPKNIFFLTCDATGVLPPISKLSKEQAMYHFISGYTAKVAGTEMDVTEPQLTFSACFGKAFLPLHPNRYAEMLGEKLKNDNVNVWLVNTGWNGGSYGVGNRIKLKYTRSLINDALNGYFDDVAFETLDVFNLQYPTVSSDVSLKLLNPRGSWENKTEYDIQIRKLAQAFIENFEKYKSGVNPEIISAQPKF